MPRENRKRGKKHKKTTQEEPVVVDVQPVAGPSKLPQLEVSDDDAPFGYVDADVKAYFRTVDDQIKAWQENENDDTIAAAADDEDPNEAKKLFFTAALTEMSGKEKQLATDPDCSSILERMLYSTDDFARRVFVDRLTGSYKQLITHRFASHVCQTLFTVARSTVHRESKSNDSKTKSTSTHGELRTLTRLILDVCEELYPSFTSLMMDPYASHVLRALLSLLSSTHLERTSARSKKSAKFKARLAPMKNVFSDAQEEPIRFDIPNEFKSAVAKFLTLAREELDGNEVRALAHDRNAGPLLQLLLQIEADLNQSSQADSLMDRVLEGLISTSEVSNQSSAYISSLLRDPTSSHLLETIVDRVPSSTFSSLWDIYFAPESALIRLSQHPVANFVVSAAIKRVDSDQLQTTIEVTSKIWPQIISESRLGVVKSIVERAGALHEHQSLIVESIYSGFNVENDKEKLVPCVMALRTLENLREEDEPKLQGALLLQALLQLDSDANAPVVQSILALPIEKILEYSHNAMGSRVFDVLLESKTVPFKSKRTFVTSLIGHYHTLVDDKIGSRVGDRCWAFADPYLREKITRSMFKHEQFLAGSFYGKFFARNMNMYLLQKKPEEWKEKQAASKVIAVAAPVIKRKPAVIEDEIDVLFANTKRRRKLAT